MIKKVHQDIYIAVGIFIFCTAGFILSIKLPSGASAFPLMLIFILLLLACLILWDGVKKTKLVAEGNSNDNSITISNLKVPLITFLIISGYFALFALTGYFIATIIFMIVFMRNLRLKSWRKILLITASFSFIIYAMFVKQLNVPVLNFGYLEHAFYLLQQ